jgi:hypothetical protein
VSHLAKNLYQPCDSPGANLHSLERQQKITHTYTFSCWRPNFSICADDASIWDVFAQKTVISERRVSAREEKEEGFSVRGLQCECLPAKGFLQDL